MSRESFRNTLNDFINILGNVSQVLEKCQTNKRTNNEIIIEGITEEIEEAIYIVDFMESQASRYLQINSDSSTVLYETFV